MSPKIRKKRLIHYFNLFSLLLITLPMSILFSSSIREELSYHWINDPLNISHEDVMGDLHSRAYPQGLNLTYTVSYTTSDRNLNNFYDDSSIWQRDGNLYIWLDITILDDSLQENSVLQGGIIIYYSYSKNYSGQSYPTYEEVPLREGEEKQNFTYQYDSILKIYRGMVPIQSYTKLRDIDLYVGFLTPNFTVPKDHLIGVGRQTTRIPAYITDVLPFLGYLTLFQIINIIYLYEKRRKDSFIADIVNLVLEKETNKRNNLDQILENHSMFLKKWNYTKKEE